MKTLKKKLQPRKAKLADFRQEIPEVPLDSTETDFIAFTTVQFFTDVSVLYRSLAGDLRMKFPDANLPLGFPPGFQFIWVDPNDPNRKTVMSGSRYTDTSLAWIDQVVDNTDVFPLDQDIPFASDFIDNFVCKIFSLLFRVFVIMHHNEYESMEKRHLLPSFFSLLKHFTFFGIRFNLLVTTDEFLAIKGPMRQLQQEYIQKWNKYVLTQKRTVKKAKKKRMKVQKKKTSLSAMSNSDSFIDV